MRVVVSGMESSGSTAIWQAACQLIGRDVTKYHGYFHAPKAITFVAIRDFRDIVASLIRREIFGKSDNLDVNAIGMLEFIKPKIEAILKYEDEPNAYFIRYEDWFGNEQELVNKMAFILDIENPSPSIADYISFKKNQERARQFDNHGQYDRVTNIHGKHITSGQPGSWREDFKLLSDSTAAQIERELDWALKHFNYK